MNKERFEYFCALLGLGYEQNLPARRLTDYPTEEIDPNALIAKNPRCFVINDMERMFVKKAVIFTSWYFLELDEGGRDKLLVFFEELIRAGYPFYVPGEHGLELIEDAVSLEQALIQLTPVNTELAIKLAAEKRLPSQGIEVINTQRLFAIKHLLDEQTFGFYISSCLDNTIADHFYPFVPLIQNPIHMQEFEEMVDGAQDGYSIFFNAQLPVLPYFEDKIYSVTLKSDTLSDEETDLISSQYPNLKVLVVYSTKITPHQLSKIINSHKNLEKIIIMAQNSLSDGALEIDPDSLLHLSELSLLDSDITAEIVNQILSRAINLSSVYMLSASLYSDDDVFHIPILSLNDLKEFRSPGCFLSVQQMQCISHAAPNISHFELMGHDTSISFLPNLLLQFNRLPRLSLKRVKHFNDFFIEFKRLVNLQGKPLEQFLNATQELDFSSGIFRAEDLATWLQIAPNITQLSIERCTLIDSELEEYHFPELPQLRYLKAGYSLITSSQLSQILKNSPHILVLDLASCANIKISDLHLKVGQFSELTELTLDRMSVSRDELNEILLAAPNLVRLKLAFGQLANNEFLELEPASCPSLRELILNSTLISFLNVNQLTRSAPFLTCLDLSGSNLRTTKNIDKLEAVSSLRIFKAGSTSTSFVSRYYCVNQFVNVINNSRDLRELEVTLDLSANIAWQRLPRLKKLVLAYDTKSYRLTSLAETLQNIPEVINLSIQGYTGYRNSIRDDAFQLKGRKFRFLRELRLSELNMNEDNLKELLSAAPGLRTVTIIKCSYITMQTTRLLRELFPNIEFESSNLKEDGSAPAVAQQSSTSTMNPSQSSVPPINEPKSFQVTGDLLHDPNQKLSFQRVFKSHGETQPTVNDDHLTVTTYNPQTRIYEEYIPKLADLKPYELHIQSSEKIEQQFAQKRGYDSENDTQEEVLLAQKLLQSGGASEWVQLPARSNADRLISFAVDPFIELECRRDKKTGYYYIRPLGASPKEVFVTYSLHTGEKQRQWILVSGREEAVMNAVERIERLRFNEQEQLDTSSNDYQALMAEDAEIRIEALRIFCHFKKESAPNFSGTRDQFLNHLITQCAGVCRHRTDLFIALARPLGIEAYFVTNYVHSFPIVNAPDGLLRSVQLGGGAANLLEQKPDKKPRLTPQEVATQIKTAPEIRKESPFQTWKMNPLKASDTSSLADELIERSAVYKRQLLLTKDMRLLDALHRELVKEQHSGKSFFSQNLDSLSLVSSHVQDGVVSTTASPLHRFLQQAAANPQEPYTWFINWSNPKAEHGSLNSVINNEQPELNGMALPENVNLVLVMDEASAQGMGKDFYSRMESRSPAPIFPVVSHTAPVEEKAIDDEHDVLLVQACDWKKELLGYYSSEQDNIQCIPGLLLQGIERAQHGESFTLSLHAPPWELDDFRWFMDELLVSRRFYFNGIQYELPGNLSINFTRPKFDFQIFEECLINPDLHPGLTELVLNSSNWKSFMPGKRVGHNGLESGTGLLELHAGMSLQLTVSDSMNMTQWYQLLREAQKHGVRLALHTTPSASLPAQYLEQKAKKTGALHSPPPINVIYSHDLDYASTIHPAVHTIPVSKDMSFESLWFHTKIHVDEQGRRVLKGEKTDLLRAIEGGKSVILKGQFAPELLKRLHTLFLMPPSLWVNGQLIKVNAPITIMTNDASVLQDVTYKVVNYTPEADYEHMPKILADRLREQYKALDLRPCHSHLKEFPTAANQEQQNRWADDLIVRLHWLAGKQCSFATTNNASASSSSAQETANGKPTSAEELITYLKSHPYVFLSGESGSGKSYLINKRMLEYARENGLNIQVFNELDEIELWAKSNGDVVILFIDEANISSEHYLQFENLANGERVLWYKGNRYVLSPNHHVVFAGNPLSYGGRFQADLFKRFPQVMEFKGESLIQVLAPLGALFGSDWQELFPVVEHWYNQALQKGLNITPRNAQMMCLDALVQKLAHPEMPIRVLMSYAILQQLKTLSLNRQETKPLTQPLRQKELSKDDRDLLKKMLLKEPREENSGAFAWVESRKKIAVSLISALNVRKERMERHANQQEGNMLQFKQEQGLNGFLLEGGQGVGKTHFIKAVLQSLNLSYEVINLGSPDGFKRLDEAYHAGKIVFIDELNTYAAEKRLNKYLSGENAKTPGFFMIGAQNPITFAKRDPLSKALENRMIKRTLPDYTSNELREIMKNRFQLSEQHIEKRIRQYERDHNYAEKQRLFPAPDSRTFINQAKKDEEKLNNNERNKPS